MDTLLLLKNSNNGGGFKAQRERNKLNISLKTLGRWFGADLSEVPAALLWVDAHEGMENISLSDGEGAVLVCSDGG